ncbi:MAG: hypothetical protein ACI9VS_003674, partial [Candidatus Binatia bacterium]
VRSFLTGIDPVGNSKRSVYKQGLNLLITTHALFENPNQHGYFFDIERSNWGWNSKTFG